MSNSLNPHDTKDAAEQCETAEESLRDLGEAGAFLKDQLSQASESFRKYFSAGNGIMALISQTQSAISEITELDHILTEIGNTCGMTSGQLAELGASAYDTASKYGRAARDYLDCVREMARSGFTGEKCAAMADQSLLAQSSGDMDAALANRYILTANDAYQLDGDSGRVRAILDGQKSITDKNGLTLSGMAAAMTEAGQTAADHNVSVEDLSAMIGTIQSVTKAGGSEAGDAIKSILASLQDTSSAETVNILKAAGAPMTELSNGIQNLRDPVSILRDLADAFRQLEVTDPLRNDILSDIGQDGHTAELSALLQNMDLYDEMLNDYSLGEGSAWEAARQSAQTLTGSLNELSNSWTSLVNNIMDSDGLKTGVDLLNGLVEGLAGVADVLGPLGTVGLGAGLFAGIKNVGSPKMYGFSH